MKTRHVLRYLCDHCNRGYWEKKSCLRHEPLCLKNPERVCGLCKEMGVTQVPLKALLAQDENWYYDVAALRNLANGCPLCMLAAKIGADSNLHYSSEERWRDFDYKAEVERVKLTKYPDGIPF